MVENKDIKYPLKSEKYKGVYQRKNGKWFYRIKQSGEFGFDRYYQKSGFPAEEEANKARLEKLVSLSTNEDVFYNGLFIERDSCDYDKDIYATTFGEMFRDFLESIESPSSRKKYQALYDAQLAFWSDIMVLNIGTEMIDLLLLKLSLKERHKKDKDGNDIIVRGYSDTYIASVRKLLYLFFDYVKKFVPYHTNVMAGITREKYKLRVLSLFSGIGAPEQALKNLGIDYELINYCEIDKNTSKAYSMLHEVPESKNLWDIVVSAEDVFTELKNMIYGIHFKIPRKEMEQDYLRLPKYDLLIFGFPCVDISTQGKQKGFKGDKSRLFFDAMKIVQITNPKFIIIENVAALIKNKNRREDLERMLEEIADNTSTYYSYHKILNAKDFGVPQSRNRAFFVLIREDMGFKYKFPKPIPLNIRAEDLFDKDIAEEYYATAEEEAYILDRDNFKPNFKKDVIPCITTGWGTPSYTNQTFIKDGDRYRCLTSEELMALQGFEKEQGTLLRKEFSKNQVGQFVGNSIAVPTIQAIIRELIDAIPDNSNTSKIEKVYIMPLFSYMGNKFRLLSGIDKLLPKDLDRMTFVDVFAGSMTVASNFYADKIVVNDTDKFLISIYKALSTTHPDKAWEMVMDIVNKYNLSADNSDGYYKCREDYNTIPFNERHKYWYWFLALVYHSFNTSTVQYNQDGNYNAPFGKFKCNIENAKSRFYPFANRLYKSGFKFTCKDYRDVINQYITDKNTFFYIDPPYYGSSATYNKYWSKDDERDLYNLLDECDAMGIKWMLSNVLKNKGKENPILEEWLSKSKNKYKVHYKKRDYSYSVYCRKNNGKTNEVIITNY